jgi:hypothetical protein
MYMVWAAILVALLICFTILGSKCTERYSDSDPKIYVAPSTTVKGQRGVFASRDFNKDELIENCPLLVNVPKTGMLTEYLFEHAKGSLLALGYGSLYNHSTTPNAYYTAPDLSNDAFAYMNIYASSPIKAGEEIFISYGDQWWSSRGKSPM